MSEKDEISKTLIRKYPPTIEDEDIETVMKEWTLAGLETYAEGNMVAIRNPLIGSTVIYQKCGGTWFWVDVEALSKCAKIIEHTAKEEARKAELVARSKVLGANRGLVAKDDYLEQWDKPVKIERGRNKVYPNKRLTKKSK